MGSTIIYKRLFEVQILHDYFLTNADGTSFFDKNKADKEDIITKKLKQKSYSVQDLFDIEPTGLTEQILNNYKMVTAPTSLGFIVGLEIRPEIVAGETVYKPYLDIDDTTNLTFLLKPRSFFFNSITNIALRPPFEAQYYFTNKDKEEFDEVVVPAYKSLPISNKVAPHQDGTLYEMGALSDFAGVIREAIQYTDGTNPSHWQDIVDKRYVNEADRRLLPNIFYFRFKEDQNVTQAEFVLIDSSDNELKTISVGGVEVLGNVKLNFAKVDENDLNSDPIPSGFYRLKVIINGSTEILYQVYLNNEIYDNDYFGLVDIVLNKEDSPSSLLTSAGYLKTKINVGGEKISHPIFEIRFKNRSTYWRYNKEGNFSAAEVAATSSFLDHNADKLISKIPKELTETLVPFQNGSSLMLPHPRTPSIKVENDRIFSEIFISQSNRLLNN